MRLLTAALRPALALRLAGPTVECSRPPSRPTATKIRMGEAVDDQDAVAAAAIFAARAESNVGFTSHDVEPIKNQWLPTMLVTQATLGEHTLGASANAEMLADMFATRDQVLYSRTPTRVTASTQLEMAAEMGRWQAPAAWRPRGGSPVSDPQQGRTEGGFHATQGQEQQEVQGGGSRVTVAAILRHQPHAFKT